MARGRFFLAPGSCTITPSRPPPPPAAFPLVVVGTSSKESSYQKPAFYVASLVQYHSGKMQTLKFLSIKIPPFHILGGDQKFRTSETFHCFHTVVEDSSFEAHSLPYLYLI